MGKIIAFANQKGGVGKTTSAVNVAASLGVIGYKVLLVDLDPQGNATSGVGVSKKNLKLTIQDVLLEKAGVEDVVIQTKFNNLSLLPANITLANAEFQLVDADNSQMELKNALLKVKDSFILLQYCHF